MNIVSQETIDKYRLIPESFCLNIKSLLEIEKMIVDLDIKNERLIELIRIVCNEEIQRLPLGLEYYNYREYSIDKISLLEIVEECYNEDVKEFMECFLKLIDSDTNFREVYYLNVMS